MIVWFNWRNDLSIPLRLNFDLKEMLKFPQPKSGQEKQSWEFTSLFIKEVNITLGLHSAQWCVLSNSSPLGVGQAPVENSWGNNKTKNVAQKKLVI